MMKTSASLLQTLLLPKTWNHTNNNMRVGGCVKGKNALNVLGIEKFPHYEINEV
jgi:hypothetical protein